MTAHRWRSRSTRTTGRITSCRSGRRAWTRVDGVVLEYALAARRDFGEEQGQAWVDQSPSDTQIWRIAVTPTWANVLDFETRFRRVKRCMTGGERDRLDPWRLAGAWCWDRVVPILETGGVVLTPTLTGSGERTAELSPSVTLARHVDDVVAELVDGDRRDVVLVGHGYSGMVITGVAERVPDRLAGLVFVDAFYPSHAESALDQMPPQFQDLFRRSAEEEGEGWRLPANDGLLDVWGLHDPTCEHGFVGGSPIGRSIASHPRRRPDDAAANSRAATWRPIPRATPKAAFGPIANKAEADGCQIHRFDTGRHHAGGSQGVRRRVVGDRDLTTSRSPVPPAFFRQQ